VVAAKFDSIMFPKVSEFSCCNSFSFSNSLLAILHFVPLHNQHYATTVQNESGGKYDTYCAVSIRLHDCTHSHVIFKGCGDLPAISYIPHQEGHVKLVNIAFLNVTEIGLRG